jgi:hypothetical protein
MRWTNQQDGPWGSRRPIERIAEDETMTQPKVHELSDKRVRKMFRPDWQQGCDNCGQKPVVPMSGLCGPCHFGTAEAINGGWWDEATSDIDEEFADEHM